MRLLVVSHTPHYRTDHGLAGWGPTVRELDRLAELFKRIVHLAPVHEEPAPASSRVYQASNLRLRPLLASGGPRLLDKAAILAQAPSFLAAFLDEAKRADAVHVRAPAHVALLAIAARRLAPRRPWWVKYAGNWRPTGETARGEAFSYRLQRRALRPDRGWAVSVNGHFADDGAHVRHFLNPSLANDELERANEAAALKKLESPRRLLFVGRLDEAKGAARALQVAAGLENARLDLAGDGPQRAQLEALAARLEVQTSFHGWLPRQALDALYEQAHVILLPSLASEGWPKVLSEAMAWGVVPVASAISSIPGVLDELGVGAAAPARDIAALTRAVERFTANETSFKEQSQRAAQVAARFTYGHYLAAVRTLFREHFGVELPSST